MGCVKLQNGLGKQYIKHFNHLESVKRYKLKNKEKIQAYNKTYYQSKKVQKVDTTNTTINP
jgi:hypothetical protein